MLTKYRTALLVTILYFAFFTRIYRLHEPQHYVFDEVYHAITAKLIARGDERAFEWWNPPVEPDTAVDWLHPPLAKYTQAGFIKILGETSFAWRLSSAVFGVGVVAATYYLAKELFKDEKISLLATAFAATDGLLLTQSRIAMNDIHVTFFILLTFIFYYKYRKKRESKLYLAATAISAGLSIATKWSGAFTIAFIGTGEVFHWLPIIYKKLIKKTKKKRSKVSNFPTKQFITTGLALVVIPIAVYITSYLPAFMQGKSLFCTQKEEIQNICFRIQKETNNDEQEISYVSYFHELHRQIWGYQTTLEATHPYQSRPIDWFLNLKPVWYAVDSSLGENKTANIYALGNPALFWLGSTTVIVTVISVLLGVLKIFTNSKKSGVNFTKNNRSEIYILAAYLIVWFPWQFSPRIMFFYHYTPAVPLLSIILAYWLVKSWSFSKKLPERKQVFLRSGVVIAVVSVVLNFALFYPHWTNMPVAKELAEKVYFALPGWR